MSNVLSTYDMLMLVGSQGVGEVLSLSVHFCRVLQTQVSSSVPQLQSAGGNPARVASLSHLGGGGFDFGTNYCTLPRKQPWRPKSVV